MCSFIVTSQALSDSGNEQLKVPLFMRRNSTGVRLDVTPSAYFEHLASALLQDIEGFCYNSVQLSDHSAGILSWSLIGVNNPGVRHKFMKLELLTGLLNHFVSTLYHPLNIMECLNSLFSVSLNKTPYLY